MRPLQVSAMKITKTTEVLNKSLPSMWSWVTLLRYGLWVWLGLLVPRRALLLSQDCWRVQVILFPISKMLTKMWSFSMSDNSGRGVYIQWSHLWRAPYCNTTAATTLWCIPLGRRGNLHIQIHKYNLFKYTNTFWNTPQIQLPPCDVFGLEEEAGGEKVEGAESLLQRLRLSERRIRPRF